MNLRKTAAIALFAASACATSPDRATSTSTEGVQAFLEAHDAAWNAHDPDALTSLFAPQGTLVTPRGTRLQGHAALRASFAQPGPTKQTSSSTHLDDVQWLGTDLAVVDARQTLTGPGVETLGASQAKLVAVIQRLDGQWKFVAARPWMDASR